LEYSILALGNFSSFGFYSDGIMCRQKPKVLKYAAGFRLAANVFGYDFVADKSDRIFPLKTEDNK